MSPVFVLQNQLLGQQTARVSIPVEVEDELRVAVLTHTDVYPLGQMPGEKYW